MSGTLYSAGDVRMEIAGHGHWDAFIGNEKVATARLDNGVFSVTALGEGGGPIQRSRLFISNVGMFPDVALQEHWLGRARQSIVSYEWHGDAAFELRMTSLRDYLLNAASSAEDAGDEDKIITIGLVTAAQVANLVFERQRRGEL